MRSQVVGLQVSSIVFGLMALGQLARLIVRPEVLVAGHQLPLWPSALAFVAMGALSLWLWRLAQLPSD